MEVKKAVMIALERGNYETIEQQLRVIWADLLDVPVASIKDKSNFFELGGNSMLILSLQVALVGSFQIEVNTRHIVEMESFADFVGWIWCGGDKGDDLWKI